MRAVGLYDFFFFLTKWLSVFTTSFQAHIGFVGALVYLIFSISLFFAVTEQRCTCTPTHSNSSKIIVTPSQYFSISVVIHLSLGVVGGCATTMVV